MDLLARLALARKHIRELSRLRRNPTFVESLSEKRIAEFGARVAVLDHDGVLGPNRSLGPDEAGQDLISHAVAVFGSGMVFILSNTKAMRKERRMAYGQQYTDVVYIVAKPKPDPDGVMQASWASGAPMDKIVVLDDGLLTGILMALECGAMAVYAQRRYMEESWMAWVIRLATTWPQIAIVRAMELLFLFK